MSELPIGHIRQPPMGLPEPVSPSWRQIADPGEPTESRNSGILGQMAGSRACALKSRPANKPDTVNEIARPSVQSDSQLVARTERPIHADAECADERKP